MEMCTEDKKDEGNLPLVSPKNSLLIKKSSFHFNQFFYLKCWWHACVWIIIVFVWMGRQNSSFYGNGDVYKENLKDDGNLLLLTLLAGSYYTKKLIVDQDVMLPLQLIPLLKMLMTCLCLNSYCLWLDWRTKWYFGWKLSRVYHAYTKDIKDGRDSSYILLAGSHLTKNSVLIKTSSFVFSQFLYL